MQDDRITALRPKLMDMLSMTGYGLEVTGYLSKEELKV